MHARLTDPELGRLLDALEPWAAGEDPDSDDARLVHWARRDFEKAVRVPADLAAEITRAKALGQQAWMEALRRLRLLPLPRRARAPRRAAPRATSAASRAIRAPLRRAARRLRAGPDHRRAAADVRGAARRRSSRSWPRPATPTSRATTASSAARSPSTPQRAAVLELLDAVGYDPDHWRLDPSLHPFARSIAPTDVRLTTKYDESDFAVALYSVLHEFGHGLYEASVDPALPRTTLAEPVSLGVHESQSRLWENVVGRSRPFCAWLLPQLRRQLPGALRRARRRPRSTARSTRSSRR